MRQDAHMHEFSCRAMGGGSYTLEDSGVSNWKTNRNFCRTQFKDLGFLSAFDTFSHSAFEQGNLK